VRWSGYIARRDRGVVRPVADGLLEAADAGIHGVRIAGHADPRQDRQRWAASMRWGGSTLIRSRSSSA
jgi:hypothetical protein